LQLREVSHPSGMGCHPVKQTQHDADNLKLNKIPCKALYSFPHVAINITKHISILYSAESYKNNFFAITLIGSKVQDISTKILICTLTAIY